jgi:hypothetical protein
MSWTFCCFSKKINVWSIKNGQSLDIGNIGHSRHRTNTNKAKITTQKTKNTDLTKCRGSPQVLAKGKQFLLLIRHPPCYSYIQSSQVKKKQKQKKTKQKNKKNNSYLRYGYFVTLNRTVTSTVEKGSFKRFYSEAIIYRGITLRIFPRLCTICTSNQ